MNLFEFLADLALKSALVLCISLGMSLLARSNASLRHLMLSCGFVACLILPLVQLTAKPTSVEMQIAAIREAQLPSQPAIAIGYASSPSERTPSPRFPVATVFLVVWLAGAVTCALRWTLGRARALHLFQAARPRMLASTSAPFPNIRVSRGPLPFSTITWGTIRPAILLPASSVDWTERELRSAIDHELAHVKRRDDLSHTVAWFATSLNWFNPLFWLGLRSQCFAAELVADEIVASSRHDPAEYAQDLLGIAAKASVKGRTPAYGVPMLQPKNIEHRIKAILTGRTSKRAGFAAFAIVLASTALAVATLGPLRARSPKSMAAQTTVEGIEHLSAQDSALGFSSNVDKDRARLVVFGDFECPPCRKIAPTLIRLQSEGYGIIFFNFPLVRIHPHARLAAQAMVAATKQGAEWRAFEALFTIKLTDESIRGLGKTLGIDEDRFAADLDSDSTKERVQDSLNLCARLKVHATPTFLKIDPDGRATQIKADEVPSLVK